MLTSTRFVVLAMFLLVVYIALHGQDQAPVPGSVGRYQLVPGEYVAINGSTGIAEKGVFRIDTTTGRVWKFQTGLGPDRRVFREWQIVGE
jgi:hypothetical protein